MKGFIVMCTSTVVLVINFRTDCGSMFNRRFLSDQNPSYFNDTTINFIHVITTGNALSNSGIFA